MNTMLKKLISALLIFAVAAVTVTPPQVAAQTLGQSPAQPGNSLIGPELTGGPEGPKPDLRKSVAAELAKVKAGTLANVDLKRLEKTHLNQQMGAPAGHKWTRKNTIFMALFIVVMTGVVWVAIKHGCKDTPEKPCPEIDYSNDY